MIIRIFFPAILILLNLLCACDMRRYPHPENEQQREILVYSGMTMIQPLLEIVELFEEREDCSVKISYGGSGHILRSVEVNQVGDIFFPGESSYVDALTAPGVVIATARIGYNEAGFFVPRGNPRNISANLENLLDKNLRVVIGNHQSRVDRPGNPQDFGKSRPLSTGYRQRPVYDNRFKRAVTSDQGTGRRPGHELENCEISAGQCRADGFYRASRSACDKTTDDHGPAALQSSP